MMGNKPVMSSFGRNSAVIGSHITPYLPRMKLENQIIELTTKEVWVVTGGCEVLRLRPFTG